jgi:hypothetical protein
MSIFLYNVFLVAERIYLVPSVRRILEILPFRFFIMVSHDCVCVVTAYCILFVKNIFLLFIMF